MTLQLPKWTHVTLPSVEEVNILKDPPKAITTRRVNKVGEDNSITNLVDGSSDRVCEAIKVYGRGVNPMVEVSYNNYSNNAGTGGTSYATRQAQAYLPYRIADGGAYRAPIIAPTDLLPLSRLPRVHTFANVNPGFVDFTKSIACGTNSRNTKPQTLKVEAPPTKFLRKDSVQKLNAAPSLKTPLHFETTANPSMKKDVRYESRVKELSLNRPYGEGYTNLSGLKTASQNNTETTVIKRRLNLGGYDARPQMPNEFDFSETQVKSAIGTLKPGNVKTRLF